jgi:hypothetical protein
MAANVEVRLLYGDGPTVVLLSSTGVAFRFKLADDNGATDNTSPIAIPTQTGVVQRSYWRTLACYATTAPANYIQRFRYYSATTGGMATGVSGYVAPASEYVKATNANDLTAANHGKLTVESKQPWTAYTASSPLVIKEGQCLGQATGYIGYLAMQMEVDSTAQAGPTTPTTHYFMYDEA